MDGSTRVLAKCLLSGRLVEEGDGQRAGAPAHGAKKEPQRIPAPSLLQPHEPLGQEWLKAVVLAT